MMIYPWVLVTPQEKECAAPPTRRISFCCQLGGLTLIMVIVALTIRVEEEHHQQDSRGFLPSYSQTLRIHNKNPDSNKLARSIHDDTWQRFWAVPQGFRNHWSFYSHSYLPRAPETAKKQQATWGSWTLEDDQFDQRPSNDFYQAFVNRDVPLQAFRELSQDNQKEKEKKKSIPWQTDSQYLAKFLPEALALTERAMQAILAEYGINVTESPQHVFSLIPQPDHSPRKKQKKGRGTWMPQASYEGLKRRLAHAILAQDSFGVALTGHSVAAGHGNPFQQSYVLQMQAILEPILARLGVTWVTHNLGMGGLGTLPTGLAAQDLLLGNVANDRQGNNDIDLLLWDAGMTDKDNEVVGILALQALLPRPDSPNQRVPLLWFAQKPSLVTHVLQPLQETTGADIATFWMPKLRNAPTEEELQALPWAARYLSCSKQVKEVSPYCHASQKYIGTCWIPTNGTTHERWSEENTDSQKSEIGGAASWHPGRFEHQLQGRALTYAILQALQEVLQEWYQGSSEKNTSDQTSKKANGEEEGQSESTPKYYYPDSKWHVTNYYREIQSKLLANVEQFIPWCQKHDISTSFCTHATQGRTEFTPRSNPWHTSLRSIMVDSSNHGSSNVRHDRSLLHPLENYFDPQVWLDNPNLRPNEADALNVQGIVESGVAFSSSLGRIQKVAQQEAFSRDSAEKNNQRRLNTHLNNDTAPTLLTTSRYNPDIKVGKGWMYMGRRAPDNCDGSYDGFCLNKQCILSGSNDVPGGLQFDGYSGWQIFTLANMRQGVIAIKIYTDSADEHDRKSVKEPLRATEGWCSENNDMPCKNVANENKNTPKRISDDNGEIDVPCTDFRMEFAINGKITSWDVDEMK